MAIDFNADVGTILKQLFNKKEKAADGKTEKNKAGINPHYKQAGLKCTLILCITAILSWCISYLTDPSTNKVGSEFHSLTDIETAVVKIEQDIASSRNLLTLNRKKVEETLPMFSDMEGSKAVFKLISNVAAENNLVIKNLSQNGFVEVTTPANFGQTIISLEMEGHYPNYMKFKQEMAKEKPVLRIEAENIKLHLGKTGERRISIGLSFIDYSVQKNEYEDILHK